MLGYLAGRLSPDRIPLLTALEAVPATPDNLKALSAAFGTTSAAPMLHVAGHTPEAAEFAEPGDCADVTRAALADVWADLNTGPARIDLVAFGSPHFSLSECRSVGVSGAGGAGGRPPPGRRDRGDRDGGPQCAALAEADGTRARLIPDICWCSITEPVLPPSARNLMTNSGKYAHDAPGLSGRAVRFGGQADCAMAARTGLAPAGPPDWLRRG